MAGEKSGPYYDPDLEFTLEVANPQQEERVSKRFRRLVNYVDEIKGSGSLKGLHHMERLSLRKWSYSLLNAKLKMAQHSSGSGLFQEKGAPCGSFQTLLESRGWTPRSLARCTMTLTALWRGCWGKSFANPSACRIYNSFRGRTSFNLISMVQHQLLGRGRFGL